MGGLLLDQQHELADGFCSPGIGGIQHTHRGCNLRLGYRGVPDDSAPQNCLHNRRKSPLKRINIHSRVEQESWKWWLEVGNEYEIGMFSIGKSRALLVRFKPAKRLAKLRARTQGPFPCSHFRAG